MLEGLSNFLEGTGQPGMIELRELLQELVGGGDAGLFLGHEALQPRSQRVFRLRFATNGDTRSLVIKRLKPEVARRNELVTQRWLPAIGLPASGPPLLGSVAARSGACVWHVYEDLGPWELNPLEPVRDGVQAAVELVANLHTRFAGHTLMGEVRLLGGDLGTHFYESSVRDAMSALKALRPPPHLRASCDRLLGRLRRLHEELPKRATVVAELGGPETLLHGDLWAINVFAIRTKTGYQARLIDWDHAAVGPATYDLSTFLLRFPPRHRRWVLELYRQAVSRVGWQLPQDRELNLLFETHEYARFANRIIWPAIAVVMESAPWGFEALAEVEKWFETFEPVLPSQDRTAT